MERLDAASGRIWFRHREGLWWYEAPLPSKEHRCQPWTVGMVNGEQVRRCACGAFCLGDVIFWQERNARRRMGER